VRIRVRHAANSAGAIFHPDAHLDMVRCGIILHGIRAWPTSRDGLELRPSLSLMTRIVHIGRRPAGWTVGYNRLHVCHKESLLATLPVGYADGYRRALTGRSVVIIRGVQVPVVGSVSMNCIVVDITALENSTAGLPQVGEKAILIGSAQETRISVEDIAELSGTIPYVVTTQLGSNIERRYLNIQSPAQVDIQKQSCLEGTQANLLEDQAFELRRVVIPSAIPLHRTTPELESTPLLEARPAGRIIHISSA
jgi:alanine racemase